MQITPNFTNNFAGGESEKAKAPDDPTTGSLQSNYNRLELNSAPIARTQLQTNNYIESKKESRVRIVWDRFNEVLRDQDGGIV